MWFNFDQNNSGGSFTVDDQLCHRLFIEADSQEKAEEKAFDMGVYYDGCSDGTDCPCCGDRWYSPDEVELPAKFDDEVYETIEAYAQNLADRYGWTKPDCRIFYADGRVVEIFKGDKAS